MGERRKTPRIRITKEVTVSPLEREVFLEVKALDLGEGGMRLLSPEEFPVGTTLFFTIEVETDDGIVDIQGEGNVIHVKPAPAGGYEIGLTFSYLPDLEREKLQELMLLQRYSAPSP
ncbi:PilZ domain-containing protein [Spirochaeta thermophila]|uniref:PilZ domain-containing protein n=1 Tax=Winmispira thermophila (strain ATCC 49972 / DSM 6192 / RI 19.B1) TaxID=665571 RepID=E0RNL2_WINT6|nr:PilZ domain-containing protein [Spirochaeta thermophila]ADN02603.1 hypothetical protein STHERM_c16650 [Spirochaeta thermophila DSM 6192]